MARGGRRGEEDAGAGKEHRQKRTRVGGIGFNTESRFGQFLRVLVSIIYKWTPHLINTDRGDAPPLTFPLNYEIRFPILLSFTPRPEFRNNQTMRIQNSFKSYLKCKLFEFDLCRY